MDSYASLAIGGGVEQGGLDGEGAAGLPRVAEFEFVG